MAIDLKVNGATLVPVDGETPWRYDLASYSVTEESTPINGSDSSGGTGTMTFGAPADYRTPSTELLINSDVEILDGSNGRTRGRVNSVSIDGGMAGFNADGLLNRLVADKQVEPFIGTLGPAIEYYMSLAEIDSSSVFVDPSLYSRSVEFSGWYGNLWDFIKQMCIAQRIEITQVSSNVIVRPLRSRTLEINNDASKTFNLNNGQLARSIEIYNYNAEYKTNGLIYPTGGWNPDVSVYSVDADETKDIVIEVDASIISVDQPAVVDFVGPDYIGPDSVYTVSGNDNLPITAAQWTAQGGYILVKINDDRKSLTVTVHGARETQYAPYSIAVSSGGGTFYSTLRLCGEAIIWDKELITIPTGVPDDLTAIEVGATIDSPFIDDYDKAYTVGMSAAAMYTAPAQTINVSASVVNRLGDVGSVNLPHFSEFDSDYSGKTFSQFDTTWTGDTFADFTAFYFAEVADNFENQAFGNVSGARVLYSYAYYRVRQATVGPEGISYTAERDTTFDDFNDVWAGKTFADYDTTYTFGQHAIQPLRA